jgi:hypothetical protein
MGEASGREAREHRRLDVRSPLSARSSILKVLPLLLILTLSHCLSCAEKRQPAPVKKSPSYDLAGEWRSNIESAGRIITASAYRIEQKGDTVELELVSTKSPSGEELVPAGMRFEARGAWQNDALRLAALSWISGRDTCTFQVRGDIDKEGRLLLHFPADLCGAKSLPYTRTLRRSEATPQ